MNNCPPETPEKTATEIEEECRIEQQKQIAKEWDKKEVSIPKGNFLFLLCYQGSRTFDLAEFFMLRVLLVMANVYYLLVYFCVGGTSRIYVYLYVLYCSSH